MDSHNTSIKIQRDESSISTLTPTPAAPTPTHQSTYAPSKPPCLDRIYYSCIRREKNWWNIFSFFRYRSLVESFLSQESEKSGKSFRINNHPAMAALSLKQPNKLVAANAYYCYITTSPQLSQELVGISCSGAANLTLAKVRIF